MKCILQRYTLFVLLLALIMLSVTGRSIVSHADAAQSGITRLYTLQTGENFLQESSFLVIVNRAVAGTVLVTKKADDRYIIFNGKRFGPYPESGESINSFSGEISFFESPFFSDRGTSGIIAAIDGVNYVLLSSGVQFGPFAAVSFSHLTDGGSFIDRGIVLGENANSLTVIMVAESRAYGPYEKSNHWINNPLPLFSNDRRDWIFSAMKNGKHYIRLSNGREYGPYDRRPIGFFRSASHWAYLIAGRGQTAVLHNGKEIGPFDLGDESANDPHAHTGSEMVTGSGPEKWSFFVKKKGKEYIVFDSGTVMGPYRRVTSLNIDEHGRMSWPMAAFTGEKMIIILKEGKTLGPYGTIRTPDEESGYPWSHSFSLIPGDSLFPDENPLLVRKGKRFYVVRENGEEIGPFSAEPGPDLIRARIKRPIVRNRHDHILYTRPHGISRGTTLCHADTKCPIVKGNKKLLCGLSVKMNTISIQYESDPGDMAP